MPPDGPPPTPCAAADVALVHDAGYVDAVLGMAGRASERLWCSLFIVDPAPMHDRDLRVLGILEALAVARWRGVDVRLLLGGSRTNLDIAAATAGASAVAQRLGVPTRWLTRRPRRGSHVKCVVADDEALTGSHNWSPGALSGQVQDSIWLRSPELVAVIADRLADQWERAG
jgi:phosphatidylserine/phosphatidylglycerophosphate/cardiolipin synthase-like enzyme